MSRAFSLLVLVALIGCGSDPTPPPKTPDPVAPAPRPTVIPPPAPEKPGDNPTQSSINISDEIKRACGISDAEALFAFDSANVRPQDKALLGKLATCFTTGPLKGREMRLVGHADPRGEQDYNMLLGQRRADNVKSAIASAGLSANKVATTSRGQLDAIGTDESGWVKDRRVDILLGK